MRSLPLTRRAFLRSSAFTGVTLALSSSSGNATQAHSPSGATAAAWLNPPKRWKLEESSLICSADPKTDFWRKTFYGYITDNGHFYYRPTTGDFSTQVKFTAQYRDLYDQAGLMVRTDAENWMKCGVEFVDGRRNMSIVYTREYSSWATGRLPAGTSS